MASAALCKLSTADCALLLAFRAGLLLGCTGAGRILVIGGPTCPVSLALVTCLLGTAGALG